MKRHFIILLCALFAMLTIGCMTGLTKLPTRKLNNYTEYISLPGVIQVDSNLYYDETELCNIYWREYLYWTGRVFGFKSIEYKSALPDTLFWIEMDSCLHPYSYYYLRHPAYNQYSLLGINKSQAEKYSKWRSDRVFENILIANNIIEINPQQNREMHFTIENYMEGKYLNYTPNPLFRYYPNYRLPTEDEWEKAVAYSDSLAQKYFKNCHSKRCKEFRNQYENPYCEIIPCDNQVFLKNPTCKVYDKKTVIRDQLYHLFGNANELSADSNITLGGGWQNTKKDIQKQKISNTIDSRHVFGFRNICEWKLYIRAKQ